MTIGAVLTDNGREFCGSPAHPETHACELYLQLNDIKHRYTKVRSPQTNGFVERFHRTLLEEFFALKLRERLYESVEALQTDLDQWLDFYNRERAHLGYRKQGRRPIETFIAFKKGDKLSLQSVTPEG